jgi:catechol 2,3-dioxygenase-like lactoylglutathione lyase family enzyme
MATATATDVVKFHLSLNSSNLARSIAFYQMLFGVEPAKIKPDYAKFEVAEPPLIMSLVPVAPTAGGTLNHVGLRVLNAATLVTMQARLEQAGYATQREDGVECCYSKQTKFWVSDPDRTLWELYVLHSEADDDHGPSAEHGVAGNSILRTEGLKLPVLNKAPVAEVAAAPAVWAHMLTQSVPERIPYDDASMDEVQLHGTLNMALERPQLAAFLAECRRVLRPGGKFYAHVLTADRAVVERPSLPGPAALVERVLPVADATVLVAEAGFVGVTLAKLAEKPCFVANDVEMRETKITAVVPDAACCDGDSVRVVYSGPLREATDDLGNVFPRGVPVRIAATAWQTIRSTGAATQFIQLGGAANAGSCCG